MSEIRDYEVVVFYGSGAQRHARVQAYTTEDAITQATCNEPPDAQYTLLAHPAPQPACGCCALGPCPAHRPTDPTVK